MKNSTLPLYGLGQEVNIIRKIEKVDGFGGVTLTTTIPIYSNRRCRITVMNDKDEQDVYGVASGTHWKVVLELSRAVQKNDFVSVPWGTYPNVEVAGGIDGVLPPQVEITTPFGNQNMFWFPADTDDFGGTGYYSNKNSVTGDPAKNYHVMWTGSAWQFKDTVAPVNFTFEGYEQHWNIFNLDWTTIPFHTGGGTTYPYSVVDQSGATKEYRIQHVRHTVDIHGAMHHTALMMEEEEVDDDLEM